jgi:hypothetical protein
LGVAAEPSRDFIAGKSEFDAQGTLTKLAGEEHWHPDIELRVYRPPALIRPEPFPSATAAKLRRCRGRTWS